MAADERSTRLRVDSDGVKITESSGVRTGVWLLVLAMGLTGAAIFLAARSRIQSSVDESPSRPDRNPEAQRVDAAPAVRPEVRRVDTHVASADAGRPEPPAQGDDEKRAEIVPTDPGQVSAAEPRDDAHAADGAGEPSGMAHFPPPGTKPIKRGIVVPEDFELPPGFVRHYQATDDGQRLPAILMFHPDYKPVDEHGVPIPLPDDRVVPVDMAPPGLPIQMLAAPENPTEAQADPEDSDAQDAAP